MKAFAYLVGLAATVVVLLVYFSPLAAAQPEQTFQCIIEEESPAAIQLGGKYIPARDTFHVLVVFAEFPDDVFDTTNVNWPKYPLSGAYPGPAYINTFVDSLVSQNSQNGNMSHYFRDMSMGAFKLSGRAYHVVAPHTRQWYLSNGKRIYDINKEALLKLDSLISFAPFDNWIRGTNYNHTKGQDGIVDMIFMLWRSVIEDGFPHNLDFIGGQADLGYLGSEYFVDSGVRRIQPGIVRSGTTSVVANSSDGRTLNLPPYRVQIHEFAHFFFPASNNWHNGGGFWAMLNDWAFRHNDMRQSVANSFERERVGWIYPDSVGPGPGQYLNIALTDYATTGSALKIKVPSSNPNEYFRVEYHLRISQFDVPEMYNPNAKGLYIIHQADTTAPFSQIRLLPSDGRWTWVSDELAYPSYYPTGLAVYKRASVDRVNGYDDSRQVPFGWIGPPPTPNVPNPSWIHFHRDRLTNQLIEQTIFRGDGRDAWSLASNNVFTPWSNPNSQNQGKQKTWVAIEIANEIPASGTIVLNVYVDSAACVAFPPSKPQDLRSTSANGCATTIKWARNLEPDLVGYNIYRGVLSGSGEPTYTKINSSLVTDTTYIDANYGSLAGLPRSTDLYHRYRVTAVDNQGKESVKSDYVDAFFTHIIDAQVANNWNMTSIPVVVCNFAKTAVYPTATSPAYKYTPGGYVQTDTLSNNFGWWIKFGGQQTITYAGTKIDSMTMPVSSGWNIIGSISVPVETCAVTSSPAGIRSSQFFKYQSGYFLTDKLYPGAGYWVKSSQNGHLILKKGAQCPPPSSPPPKDKFIVTDSEGNQQELYVVNAQVTPDAESIEMPPAFTEADFDVRWGTGDFETVVEPTGEPIELPIDLNEVSFPITLEWELDPANGLEYTFDGGGLGKGSAPQLGKTGRSSITLVTPRIRLTAKSGGITQQLPTAFALHQNYPNPFNPTTTIRYQLPEDEFVVLRVFDVLGRAVATLVNERITAGYHSASFGTDNLSSGMYFARLSVSNSLGATVYEKTTKLILMK